MTSPLLIGFKRAVYQARHYIAVLFAILLLAVAIVWIRQDKTAPVRREQRTVRSMPFMKTDLVTTLNADRKSQRRILFDHGLLSLELHEQRLGPVLREIARQSAVAIFSVPAVDDQVISLQMRPQPLDQALRKLLTANDAFFQFGSGKLQTVWAYETRAGAGLVPVPPESWASTVEFERQLTAESPAERILAIETLVARNGGRTLEYVNRALGDQDAEVRLRALDVSLSAGVVLPSETLSALTYDESAAVRALALEAIVSGTDPVGPHAAETTQLIHRMLGDADAAVRARAKEMLATPTEK